MGSDGRAEWRLQKIGRQITTLEFDMPNISIGSGYVSFDRSQQSFDIPPTAKYVHAAGAQAYPAATSPEFEALEKAAQAFEKNLNSTSAKFSDLCAEVRKMRGEIYEFRETSTPGAYAVLKEGVPAEKGALYIAKLCELQAMQDSAKKALGNISGSSVDRMFSIHHSSPIYLDMRALANGKSVPHVYTSSDRCG